MKKGFTLVELLATLTILAILSLLVVPGVDSMLKKQKEKLYKISESELKDALKMYGDDNIDLLPEKGETFKVTLATLKDEGLIKLKFKNPKTKKCFYNGSVLSITNDNDVYMYNVDSLLDGKDSDCGEDLTIYPKLVLDSNKVLDTGDKFCIGTECFYVISNNSGTVRALAEWNIDGGYDLTENGEYLLNIYDYTFTYSSALQAGVKPYYDYQKNSIINLKQNPNKRGFVFYPDYNKISARGVINFASDYTSDDYGYWAPSGNLISSYASTMYVYDSNSVIYDYIESYIDMLNEETNLSLTGDLITLEEVESLGCDTNSSCLERYVCTASDVSNEFSWYDETGEEVYCETIGQVITSGGTAPSWVYNTTYWTGSAEDTDYVWTISSDGDIISKFYSNIYDMGIRPVITISENDIK